jgi:hypothetical protein
MERSRHRLLLVAIMATLSLAIGPGTARANNDNLACSLVHTGVVKAVLGLAHAEKRKNIGGG